MERNTGLMRPLTAGESVILSSGATATVRRSYPAGYDGDVEISLDGAAETERVSGLTLVEPEPTTVESELGDAAAAQRRMGESRAPTREMKN